METEASVFIDGLTVRVKERKTSRMTLRFVALISVWMVVQLTAGQRINSFVMVRIILRGLRDEMSSRELNIRGQREKPGLWITLEPSVYT